MYKDIIKKIKLSIFELSLMHVNTSINLLEDVSDEIKDILQPHWDIQSCDEQYSDPEMWDYSPLYDIVSEALDNLYDVMFLCSDEDDLEDYDIKKVNEIVTTMNKQLTDTER